MQKKKKLIIGTIALAVIVALVAGLIIINPFRDPDYVNKSVYMDPDRDIEDRVDALLSQMTLDEKVAQMVQPEQDGISADEVTSYGIGTVLSGGGSDPESGNSADNWQTRVNELKQAALETRLGIPLLYGVDAVHGHNNIEGATVFPHNIGLGATGDEDLMERIGQVVAKEVRATGIQWTFAPTLANPQSELWGRTYEGFSENVDDVASLGAAFIRGMQGVKGSDNYLTDVQILATAKHYIGEGYTEDGVNQGNVNMPYEEFEELLDETLLTPYIAAVEAGARTVMASYNSVSGTKCHEHSILINDVLKGELGFTGFVIGDYNAVQQLSGATYKEQIANAVNAGVDVLMEPGAWRDTIQYLKENVEDGSISEERIDDAVRRILRVKFEAGLFEEEINSDTENHLKAEIGSEEHREIAREAVRKSMVLLKNDKVGNKTAIEVLADAKNILVAGTKADNIGVQCGGWTISWQGSMGDITQGTTILEGLQNAAGDRNITYSAVGHADGTEDAIIVVVGELPYAESSGDRIPSALTFNGSDINILDNMADTIKEARNKGIPVVMVMLTGRPVNIADYVDQFDAIVEAWWPGTEGDGVADVLLGDYDFSGTLTYTWPLNPEDIEEKFNDGSKVLFNYGTGLKKDGTSIK